METGLDNANNPFTNSNGSLKNLEADTENINLQKSNEGLLLNLTDNFKANGTDLSEEIFKEKSNGGKKSASDHFDDDFGPETDVDAVDDAFSPVIKDDLSKDLIDASSPKSFTEEIKQFTEGLVNNNPLDDGFNPFLNQQKDDNPQESREVDFDEYHGGENREETPTPPADTVQNVSGLEVNPTESDSEDEWNYIKGDQAKPENFSSQPETVVEGSEQEDAMSQLNPNAAEFVPISPTRSIPSPVCRALINDEVISESPKRPVCVDFDVGDLSEFESEIKSRPSDFDRENGRDSENEEQNASGGIEKIENILNGKSIDEIPEFHPGSTPSKVPSEEFHFGPNAAPFTPRVLDQSEAFSTKANYGDNTERTLNSSFNDSDLAPLNKEQTDPMSMSFYAEKGVDLNKIHPLPENMDEFLQDTIDDNKENIAFNETISDLPEHFPLGMPLDNDQATVQTTDLDKISQDDEKELASLLENQDDLLDINPSASVPPANDIPQVESNLLDDFMVVSEKPLSDDSNIASLPELEPIDAPIGIPESVASVSQPMFDPFATDLQNAPLEIHSLVPQDDANVLPSPYSLPIRSEGLFQDDPSENRLDVDQFKHEEGRVESHSPACEFRPESTSPVCELEPVSELIGFDLKTQVENINLETKESYFLEDPSVSPVPPACEYSAEPESCELTPQDIPESQSPIDMLQEQRHEEEVTSSVKDDLSSPMSPVKSPEFLVEDNEATTITLHVDETKHEVPSQEISSHDILLDVSCPFPAAQSLIETSEINGQLTSEFNIKTDSITPEFAEPAIISPSEDSKAIDQISDPSPTETLEKLETFASELQSVVPQAEPLIPQPVEEPSSEPPIKEDLALPTLVLDDKKSKGDEKKSPVSATRRSLGKVESKKPTPAKLGVTKTSSKPTASSPKPGLLPKVAPKTGIAKAPGIAPKTTTTASKLLPKPKTATAPKLTEKKPDVKPATRTVLAKKPTVEPPATKTITRPSTARPATTVAKTNLTKSPRSTTAPKTTTSTTVPTKPSTVTAKPRPLSSTTTTTTTNKLGTTTITSTTTAAAKPIPPNRLFGSSPKAAAPRTITSAAPKPRVPLTKTVTKSADVEKEKKESANKLTASRSTSVTKTTSGTVTSRTTTTTVRKTETKPIASKTTTRTTTLSKKPGEVKTTSSKAKTTQVEKPKQNGVAPTNITEEIKAITIVNNVVNDSQTENLVKDNSPLDNKLLIETSNALIDMNPAD